MVVISHFVLVFDILTLLVWIIFEGSMTEATLHGSFEFVDVIWCNDEAFLVVVVIYRVLLESHHAGYELLHIVGPVDCVIRFVELAELALDFVSPIARSMLFVEMGF